jgi:hypothetical protein
VGALEARSRRISGVVARPGSVASVASVVLAGQGAVEAGAAAVTGQAEQRLNAQAEVTSKGVPEAEAGLRLNGVGEIEGSGSRVAALAANLARLRASGIGSIVAPLPTAAGVAEQRQVLVASGVVSAPSSSVLGRLEHRQVLVGHGAVSGSSARMAALARRTWQDDPLELALLDMVEDEDAALLGLVEV